MINFIEQHSVRIDHLGFSSAVDTLAELVEQNREENQLQAFIEEHPYILSQQFAHCHHVFARVKLGERFEADFFCLDIPSSGKEWIGVEIEPPGIKVITKSGRKSARLEHALQQIRDWRKWVADNIDYARRPRHQSGLGLENIQPRLLGLLVVGRRKTYNETFNDLRKQIHRDELIQISSWDGILEWAKKRALIFEAVGKREFYWEQPEPKSVMGTRKDKKR